MAHNAVIQFMSHCYFATLTTFFISLSSISFVQEIEAVGSLRQALINKWNQSIMASIRYKRNSVKTANNEEISSTCTKRRTHVSAKTLILRESDIVPIHGSHYKDGDILYYSFYVEDGKL